MRIVPCKKKSLAHERDTLYVERTAAEVLARRYHAAWSNFFVRLDEEAARIRALCQWAEDKASEKIGGFFAKQGAFRLCSYSSTFTVLTEDFQRTLFGNYAPASQHLGWK